MLDCVLYCLLADAAKRSTVFVSQPVNDLGECRAGCGGRPGALPLPASPAVNLGDKFAAFGAIDGHVCAPRVIVGRAAAR